MEDDQGRPIEKATLTVHPEIHEQWGGPIHHKQTDEQGEYVLRHLADTNYAFNVESPGYEPLRGRVLELTPGKAIVLALDAAEKTKGAVLREPSRKPLAGATIRLVHQSSVAGSDRGFSDSRRGSWWGESYATTDSLGRFELDRLTRGALYSAVVEAADGSRAIVDTFTTGKTLQVVMPARRDLVVNIQGDLRTLGRNPSVGVRQQVNFYPRPREQVGELLGADVPIEPTDTGGRAVLRGLAVDLRENASKQMAEVYLIGQRGSLQTVEINPDGQTVVGFDLEGAPQATPATELDRALSEADADLRAGLRELAERFPLLKKGQSWESVSRPSAAGRIGVHVHRTQIGKGRTDDKPFAPEEAYSVLVVVMLKPSETHQLSLSPQYKHLGLVGQVHSQAANQELASALEQLIDRSLEPVAALERRRAAQAQDSQSPRGGGKEGPSGPLFSKPKELVLSTDNMAYMLDLDSGRTMDIPQRPRPEQTSMDIHPNQVQPYQRPTGVTCRALKCVRVATGEWETTAAEVDRKLLRSGLQSPRELLFDANEAATYLFETKNGGRGVLQLLALVDDPKGIRLRYKLLKHASSPTEVGTKDEGEKHDAIDEPAQSIPQDSLVVKLRDKQGAPVSNVKLRVYDGRNAWRGQATSYEMEFATSDERGNAVLPVVFERIPDQAGYCIQIYRPKGASWRAPERLIGSVNGLAKLHVEDPLVDTRKTPNGFEITVTLRQECPADIEILDASTGKRKHFAQLLFKDDRVDDWTVAALQDYVGDPGGDDPSRLGLNFFTTLIPEMSNAQFMATHEGYYPVKFRLSEELGPAKIVRQRVELRPAPSIELTILTPGGKPAVGAELEYDGPDVRGSYRPLKPSDDAGNVTLRYPELGKRARWHVKHPSGQAEVGAEWVLKQETKRVGGPIKATVKLQVKPSAPAPDAEAAVRHVLETLAISGKHKNYRQMVDLLTDDEAQVMAGLTMQTTTLLLIAEQMGGQASDGQPLQGPAGQIKKLYKQFGRKDPGAEVQSAMQRLAEFTQESVFLAALDPVAAAANSKKLTTEQFRKLLQTSAKALTDPRAFTVAALGINESMNQDESKASATYDPTWEVTLKGEHAEARPPATVALGSTIELRRINGEWKVSRLIDLRQWPGVVVPASTSR